MAVAYCIGVRIVVGISPHDLRFPRAAGCVEFAPLSPGPGLSASCCSRSASGY